jgi:hypothetical protein
MYNSSTKISVFWLCFLLWNILTMPVACAEASNNSRSELLKSIISECTRAIELIADPTVKQAALANLEELRAQDGDVIRTLQLPSQLPPSLRARVTTVAICQFAAFGDFGTALGFLDNIRDVAEQRRCYVILAKIAVQRGRVELMQSHLARVNDSYLSGITYCSIASEQAICGDDAQARKNLDTVLTQMSVNSSLRSQSELQKQLARTYAYIGALDKAFDIMRGFKRNSSDYNESLEIIAHDAISRGNLLQAKGVVEQMKPGLRRDLVLRRMAVSLAAASQDAVANDILVSIADELQDFPRAQIAIQHCRIGNVQQALAEIRSVRDPLYAVSAAGECAVICRSRKENAMSIDTFMKYAVTVVDGIPKAKRAGALRSLAQAYARLGNLGHALLTAELIVNSRQKSLALREIARASVQNEPEPDVSRWLANMRQWEPESQAQVTIGLMEGILRVELEP